MRVKTRIRTFPDTPRVADLRQRVRAAMDVPPVGWDCPSHIEKRFMSEPLAVRKARAIQLKLSCMPADLWEGQPFAGSMTLESPRLHTEWAFPQYTTEAERADADRRRIPRQSEHMRMYLRRLRFLILSSSPWMR
jgi:hypothetical protein